MTMQANNPFGSVVGYDKQIRRLTEILDIVNRADKYRSFDIQAPKSLLLYGEIDVGKTFMARAFVNGCERNVFEITDNCDSYKKLHKLFCEAKKYAPSVIFADEIDSCPEDMIASLAEEMAAVDGRDVFLVATFDTDVKHTLDAVWSLNFYYRMEITDADFDDSCKIIDALLSDKKLAPNFNREDLYYLAQYRTAAKFEKACNSAALIAAGEGSEYITTEHFIKAFVEIDEKFLAAEFYNVTAHHEAGHAAVNMLMGGIPAYIMMFDNDAGEFFSKRETFDGTIEDKIREYVTGLGGKASEEVMLNSCSTGCYSDLKETFKLIEADLSKLATVGFEYYNSPVRVSVDGSDRLVAKVQQQLAEYYDKAKILIEQNRPLVQRIAEKLKEKPYLLHSELTQIYTDYVQSK